MDLDNDPDFKAWKARVNDELVPKIEGSALSISIVPEGETDIKFAVELGLAVCLDKPIIAVVRPGTKIPAKLALVADEIVAVDLNTSDPHAMRLVQQRIGEAVGRIINGEKIP